MKKIIVIAIFLLLVTICFVPTTYAVRACPECGSGYVRSTNVNLWNGYHELKCDNPKCNFTMTEKHTYETSYRTSEETHYIKCTGCTSIKINEKHVFGEDHRCKTCKYMYNRGNKIDGKYEYTTHIFKTINENAKCTICGTVADVETNVWYLPLWDEYEPDEGYIPKPSSVYIELTNGIVESPETATISYSFYTAHTRAWHENLMASLRAQGYETSNDWWVHLESRGQVRYGGILTATSTDKRIEFKNLPSGAVKYSVSFAVDGSDYRYNTQGIGPVSDSQTYTVTIHYKIKNTDQKVKDDYKSSSIKKGENFTISDSIIPESITKDDKTYIYDSRSDNSSRSDAINNLTENKEITVWYSPSPSSTNSYTVTIHYKEKDTNKEILKDYKSASIIEGGSFTITDSIIPEYIEKDGKKYLFNSRSDSNSRTDTINNLTENKEITVWYNPDNLNHHVVTIEYKDTVRNENFLVREIQVEHGNNLEYNDTIIENNLQAYFGDKSVGYTIMSKVLEDGNETTLEAIKGEGSTTITENKTLVYYYTKDIKAHIRYFVAEEVNDKIIENVFPGLIRSNDETIKRNVTKSLESEKMDEYEYRGYIVTNSNVAPQWLTNIYNQKDAFTTGNTAKYKSENGEDVYVDFFYVKKNYSVTVEYQEKIGENYSKLVVLNEDGFDEYRITNIGNNDSVLDEGSKIKYIREKGDKIKLFDNDELQIGNVKYSLIEKNPTNYKDLLADGVNQELKISLVYEKQGHSVTVYYKDIDTGNNLRNSEIVQGICNGANYQITTDQRIKITNTKIYNFQYSTIGEDKNGEKIVGNSFVMGDEDVVVTCWYKIVKPVIKPPHPDPHPDSIDETVVTSQLQNSSGINIIVLDEKFTIRGTITDSSAVPEGSYMTIKFPFDVYYDDGFKKAKTEFTVVGLNPSMDEYRFNFRLPSWVKEQTYEDNTVISLYSPDKEKLSSINATIMVVGKVYDFTITNLEGDSIWQLSMFGGKNKGTEYKADTLPIGQSTANSNVSTVTSEQKVGGNIDQQNLKYKYGLKLGSTFLFSINTKGLKSNSIQVTPKLEYYDKDGNKRDDVKYTYKVQGYGEQEFAGTNGLVTANATGNVFETTLNKATRITAETSAEIKKAMELKSKEDILTSQEINYANVSNAYKGFNAATSTKFGSYGNLKIPNTLRLPYANYASSDLRKAEVHRIGNEFSGNDYTEMMNIEAGKRSLNYVTNNIADYDDKVSAVIEDRDLSRGVTRNDVVINSLGHWYAEYKLPETLEVKSSDGKTKYTDGFIVLNFKIETYDNEDNTYLTYSLAQWKKENNSIDNNGIVRIKLPKTPYNNNEKEINVSVSGSYYPVAVYEAGQSIGTDYEAEITH